MIFATDLDNTIVFSHRKLAADEPNVCCVEYYKGQKISYMTLSALNKLTFISENVFLVPATTRSFSQFKRIEFLPETEFVIIDNGGTILRKGIVIQEWSEHINKILEDYDFSKALEAFYPMPTLISEPKVVDGKFLFAKVSDAKRSKEYLEKILDTKKWTISATGYKLYAFPAEITKGNALEYIHKKLLNKHQTVVSAGDSEMDISMLEYSDFGIVPFDCSISDRQKFIKKGHGIYTADKILDYVIELNSKHEYC